MSKIQTTATAFSSLSEIFQYFKCGGGLCFPFFNYSSGTHWILSTSFIWRTAAPIWTPKIPSQRPSKPQLPLLCKQRSIGFSFIIKFLLCTLLNISILLPLFCSFSFPLAMLYTSCWEHLSGVRVEPGCADWSR